MTSGGGYNVPLGTPLLSVTRPEQFNGTVGVKFSMPRFRRILQAILRDAESGADTALWLAGAHASQLARLQECASPTLTLWSTLWPLAPEMLVL